MREGEPNCGRGALGGMEWSVGLGCAGGGRGGGVGLCACVFCDCGSAGGLRAGLVVLGIGFRLAVFVFCIYLPSVTVCGGSGFRGGLCVLVVSRALFGVGPRSVFAWMPIFA